METKPAFSQIYQIGFVVKDVYKTVKRQWEQYGIGPWVIYTFDSSNVSDMIIRGKPENYALKIASTMINNVAWELIQPLDDKTTHAEFLKEHGEGIHHVIFQMEESFDESMAYFQQKGLEVLLGGNFSGLKFAYFDTTDTLGTITEISIQPKEGMTLPQPEAIYPNPL